MKSLIVFYSLEGNTKLVATKLKEKFNCDILELKLEKEIPNSGFKKYIWGGKSVVLKEYPKLLPFDVNFEIYDRIFIGSPVWAGTYAAAFNTFFKENSIKNKDIVIFICHGGGSLEKCYKNLSVKLEGNNIIEKLDFLDPLKNEKELLKLEDIN